ncbi:DUF6197 family protein [Streptomyces microflavus]|uniref:DUF6197 family protein n=1 Tax=Streptomyces microflavus TaxID=1919 RepID=UPI00368ED56E
MTDDTKAKELLTKAREILERDGWHQGSLENGGYSDDPMHPDPAHPYVEGLKVCSVGALQRANSGSALHRGEDLATFTRAYELLVHKGIGDGFEEECGIAGWNDHPNRTQEDVLLAFKRAAG